VLTPSSFSRPDRLKERPDLAQVVIQDRLAAVEPKRLQQLADPDPRHTRITIQ
jgi:hypothetical protein